jgi:hypothetical protein
MLSSRRQLHQRDQKARWDAGLVKVLVELSPSQLEGLLSRRQDLGMSDTLGYDSGTSVESITSTAEWARIHDSQQFLAGTRKHAL